MRFSNWSRLAIAASIGLGAITSFASYKIPTPPQPEQQAKANNLAAYYWEMVKALDSSGQVQPQWEIQGAPAARLVFDKKGNVYSESTCNSLPWAYTLQGNDRLTFKPNGGVTLMGCSDGREWRQSRMYSHMPTAKAYRLEHHGHGDVPRLTLRFADGSQWEFAGLATPETRYGSPGIPMELEIALDKVPCGHGSDQCSQARAVRYDRSTKTCLGDWQVLTTGVEGYQHRAGRHEIIAVQAYPLAKATGESPKNAYVLRSLMVSVDPNLKKLPECAPRNP